MTDREEFRKRRKERARVNDDEASRDRVVEEDNGGRIGVIDIVRLLGGLILLNCLLSYFVTNDSLLWGWRPWFVRPGVVMGWFNGPVLLTDAELLDYNGSDPAKPIFLALNGTIYDVTSGSRLYGPEGGYHVFAGKDAARGFITGCFAEDSTPDMRGAEWTYVPTDVVPFDHPDGVKATAEQKVRREQELRKARNKVQATIEGWAKMFRGDKQQDYFEVGTVVREDEWLDKLPRRTLCAQAEKGRPKPKEKAKDAGEKFRGS